MVEQDAADERERKEQGELGVLLRKTVGVLEELGVPYMVGGAFASSAYGEPRYTLDIDIVVDLKARDVRDLCRAFPESEYYLCEETARKAADNGGLFSIIWSETGAKVDLIVPKMDAWNRLQMSRRRRVRILPEYDGFAASPEDVILSKMDYYGEGGSEKHLRDITGILKISGDKLDRRYIAEWAERRGTTEIWQAVLRKLGQQA